jgi:AraC-like DNA-binding protein
VCPENKQLDLLYLSWGRRRYGQSPIPISRHHGWLYVFIVKGNPTLRLIEGSLPVQPGEILIIDPECASGWIDVPVGIAEVLGWEWRAPPQCSDCTPSVGGFKQFQTDPALRRVIKQAHALCRAEVERPDQLTRLAIMQARLQIDLALGRLQRPTLESPKPALRLELALSWLARNLAEPNPVTALCEYMQVSAITLNRLFRAHLTESVVDFHHRLKMERAHQIFERGDASVKEASYILGYKYPHDFSRAFQKASGRKPSDFIRQLKH